jgi:cation diffusion facilitator CzcD-associated flavoprotein CzcO
MQGLKVKVFEKAPASGGVWYWNTYPGARVDTDAPVYQLYDKELWEDFTFKERYPGQQDLKRYFDHVEKKWDLAKDIEYNKCVEGASFDESRHQWLVECSDGTLVYTRFFVPALGFASKPYVPYLKGLSDFKGEVCHTANWPQWGLKLKGKRVAVIGTGASGIQCIQDCGKVVKHLTVFQRTPNFCLPMNQGILNEEEEQKKKDSGAYQAAFDQSYTTFTGFTFDFYPKNTFDDSREEREALFQKLFDEGGFRFWLASYQDMLFNPEANKVHYDFWRKWVHTRVKDPAKAEILAPAKAPHPFGSKRPCLEQDFYEVVNQPNIDIVDLNVTPIVEITETGLRTVADGLVHEVDVIILATGFDAVTGGLTAINIEGTAGKTVKETWAEGVRTNYGLALSKFPNMFLLYGPQSPTAFANGPTCTQVQADFVDKLIKDLRQQGVTRIEPTEASVDRWVSMVKEVWDSSLFPQAKSWYQGANIPGKKVEPLNWYVNLSHAVGFVSLIMNRTGGLPPYIDMLNKSLGKGLEDWVMAP